MFGCRTASAPACCLFLRTARHTCSDQSMLSSCWAAAVFGQSAYTNDFLGFQASRAFQRLRPSSYWSTRRRPVKHTLQVIARNRLLFQASELQPESKLVLASQDSRSSHLLQVLKVQPQDQVKVGVINGPSGLATVLQTHPDITLECTHWQTLPAPIQLYLVLAMPRPKVMKRLWSVLACLGITRAYITGAEKVEKVYFASHTLNPERFCSELIRGAEQAGDTRLPAVYLSKSLKATLAAVQAAVHPSQPSQQAAMPAQTALAPAVPLQHTAVPPQTAATTRPTPTLSVQQAATLSQTAPSSQLTPSLPANSDTQQPQAQASVPLEHTQEQAAALPGGPQPQADRARGVQCLLPEGVSDLDTVTLSSSSSPAMQIGTSADSLAMHSQPKVSASSHVTDHTRPAIKLLAHTAGGLSVRQAVWSHVAEHATRTVKSAGSSCVAGGLSGFAEAAAQASSSQPGAQSTVDRIGWVAAEQRPTPHLQKHNSTDERPVVVLAIGPEGGWADSEVALLTNEYGFRTVTTASSRTLDTTTAVISLVSLALDAVAAQANSQG